MTTSTPIAPITAPIITTPITTPITTTMKSIVLLLVLLAISSHLSSEEIRYIRDELYVPLRSGQTMQHRIVHKGLVSGTSVILLETSEGDPESYSLVRTRRGIEGWIQTQYLSPLPAGRDLYKAASEKLSQLQQQHNALKQQLSALQNKDRQAQKKLSTLTDESTKLNREVEEIKAISANTIAINSDNQRLSEENQMLKNEVDILNTNNQRLNDAKDNDAFLNGAFAVLIGVMITLLVPRLWPRKSTDWA